MSNSTSHDQAKQPSRKLFAKRTIRLYTKIAICKELKPLYRFIISALYDFAMSPSKNNQMGRLLCGYHHLVKTYGYSKETIRDAINSAKKAGFLSGEIGDLRFVNPISIATVTPADFPQLTAEEYLKANIPEFIEVPPIISSDPDFQKCPLAKITFGFLWYRVFEDGEIFFTNQEVANVMGESKDRIKKHVQRFISKGYFLRKSEPGKANRLVSVLNNHKVYAEVFESYKKAHKYDYDTEKLSTDSSRGGEIQPQGGGNTAPEVGKYGPNAININNNEKIKKVACATKAIFLDQKEDSKPDYVPDWKTKPKEASCTIPEYGSEEFLTRNQNRAIEHESRRRAEKLMKAFVDDKTEIIDQDIDLYKKPVKDPELAFNHLSRILGSTRQKPDQPKKRLRRF